MSGLKITTARLVLHNYQMLSKHNHREWRHVSKPWSECENVICSRDRDLIAEAEAEMQRKGATR